MHHDRLRQNTPAPRHWLLLVLLVLGVAGLPAPLPVQAVAAATLKGNTTNLDHVLYGPLSATQQTATLTSSYDGTPHTIWYGAPASYDPLTPTPLLVGVHGFSARGDRTYNLLDEATFNRGWLLVSVDMHNASTVDVSSKDLHDYGKRALAWIGAQHDVIDAIQFMQGQYNVDTSRIYIAGGSMGGMMATTMAAKYPDVFAAAAAWKPMTDMTEWYDDLLSVGLDDWTLDVRAEADPSCTPAYDNTCGTPEQEPFEYARRSPRQMAQNLQYTPLHLWHDTTDTWVMPAHSSALFDAVKAYNDQAPITLELVTEDPNCNWGCHLYAPPPISNDTATNLFDFLAQHTLPAVPPADLHIRTDESKPYFWLNIARGSEDHWTEVAASYDITQETVSATVSNPEPLALGFNLGSSTVSDGVVSQAGMGLPETTYLVRGGGNNRLIDYSDSTGYYDIIMHSTGTYNVSISSLAINAVADPATITADGQETTVIRVTVTDQTGAPVPDGTEVSLSTTAGTFATGNSTTATTSGGTGKVGVLLTAGTTSTRATITIRVRQASAQTTVEMQADTPSDPPGTYRISGHIVDINDRPVGNVAVHVEGGSEAMTSGDGTYTLSSLEPGTYTLTPLLDGYTFEPASRTVTVSSDVSEQDFTALPTLDSGFQPDPDGYKFNNYLGSSYADYHFDEMRAMFGDDAVCMPDRPRCTVKRAAAIWYLFAYNFMKGGHCYGMAVTSSRFFSEVDEERPRHFESDARHTYDLELSTMPVRQHIAYYHVQQLINPISGALNVSRHRSVQDNLDVLHYLLSDSTSGLPILGLISKDNGAHAITPYAIQDRGNGIYHIMVYDNNHPGDANRSVRIDTNANTWRYDMGGTLGIWSSDQNPNSLAVIPLSLHAKSGFDCPWCAGTQLASGTPSGQIWATGASDMLITDAQGHQLGYTGDQFVSDIPGAYKLFLSGGLGISVPPIYQVPLTTTYTLTLEGQTSLQQDADPPAITQFGPGYAVAVEDVQLAPEAQGQVRIAADGTEVAYAATDADTPSIMLVHDGEHESIRAQVQEASVGAGKVLTATVDVARGTLVVNNAENDAGSYNLEINRTDASGVYTFTHTAIEVSAGETHYADYGAWDGAGDINVEIDRDSDGTIDDQVELVDDNSDIAVLELTADTTSLAADGQSTTTIHAAIADTDEIAIASEPITFTTSLGTINPAYATTDDAGHATATLTAGTTPGIATITVSASGVERRLDVRLDDTTPQDNRSQLYLPLVVR